MAILAEKYAVDYTWYVDVMLNLIRIAGDYVSEEVWYRVIQIVVNRPDVQGYAAKTVFEALQAPACHENMVKVGGYILGEFGNLIAGDPRSSPAVQFEIIHSKYHLCTPTTRCLLLSTYMKFINLFPEIKQQIQDVYRNEANIKSADVEIQQRTVEYLRLSQIAGADVLATVLEEMPPFVERESSILSNILQKKKPIVESTTSDQLSEAKTTTKETTTTTTSRVSTTSSATTSLVSQSIKVDYQQPTSNGTLPSSQSIDLLGINQISPTSSSMSIGTTPAAAPAPVYQPPKSNQDALFELFGDTPTQTQVKTTSTNHVNGNNSAAFDIFASTPFAPAENGFDISTNDTAKDNHLQ